MSHWNILVQLTYANKNVKKEKKETKFHFKVK
jgi:hypothetical protein